MCAGVLIAGCNSSNNAQPSAETTGNTGAQPAGKELVVGIVFDSGGLGDKSFNDSAWRGVEKAVAELGIKEKHIESKSEKDFEPNLEAMAQENCDIVFAVGISMKSALEKVAPKYKDIKFAIVDAPVDLANVRSLLFKEEEGSFLAGYLAGLMSKTNKIGFVGGMEIPLIKKFQAGYEAGAKTANPNLVVLPAKYVGSWENVDQAKTAAISLFNEGADVVYHAAGRAGLGVLDAAKEKGLFGIGVDSDQDDIAPGNVLTSMIKRVDEAVFATIKDIKDGKWSTGSKIYDLAVGGVGLSEFKHTKDKIGEENLGKVGSIATKIRDGEIKVPDSEESLAQYLNSIKK